MTKKLENDRNGDKDDEYKGKWEENIEEANKRKKTMKRIKKR